MTVRVATERDAELLANHRAAVWLEAGGWSSAEIEPELPGWTAFLRRRLRDGTYVAFVADDGHLGVGSVGIIVQPAMPRPFAGSERSGRVQSMYVEPASRRRGVARALMARALAYAREARLVSLSLHPSAAGRPLYASLGFEATDEMIYRFTGRRASSDAVPRAAADDA